MKIKDATGKDVYPIKFADYGINMVSSGIIANTDYVKANADLVRRFMSATTKAVEAAEKEPKGAAQSILDANPKGGKIDTLTQGFELTIPLYRTPETKGKRPFQVTDQNMTDTRQPDGRIWRARCQGQGQSEGVLHQRLSAEERHRETHATSHRALEQLVAAGRASAAGERSCRRAMPSGIKLSGVSKTYRSRDGDVPSLRPLDFHINDGEFFVVVGPSGCGKSTLLKMISGLLPPSTGEILVEGEKVTKPHGNVGIVFQNALLLPWRNILVQRDAADRHEAAAARDISRSAPRRC